MHTSATDLAAIQHATSDDQLLALWLHDRPAHTQRAYRADIARFTTAIGKPLPTVTLGDLQAFSNRLSHLAPSTKARTLSAVKSLLSFGHRLGYLTFDVGRAVRLPRLRLTLAERILEEGAVQRLLALEPDPRNRAILVLFYASGIRVSELVALRWRNVQPCGQSGQVTVLGKDDRTRAVLLPVRAWAELQALDQGPHDGPVFVSRLGGHLDPSQVRRIVLKAAQRAGIPLHVSPHWLRHAHASHALDHGAPISLVKETLGHASVETTGRYLHARPGESSGKYLPL